MSDDIGSDKRTILYIRDDPSWDQLYTVGRDSVTGIRAYEETGHMAHLAAVEITFRDGRAARLILAPGMSVHYARPEEPEGEETAEDKT